MTDWNGTDPITSGMRLTARRISDGFTIRKFIVLYISDQTVIGQREGQATEIIVARSDVEFSVLITDRQVAIDDMVEITGKSADQWRLAFSKIYDAGYRKS